MEYVELFGPKGAERSGSFNLLASTASITSVTLPSGGGGAVAPDNQSFYGDIKWLVDANLSGTTDSFLVELEGRHNDGATATSWGVLASATYTADDIEYVDVINNPCNEFRVVVTRTGSTDTLTLACWLLKAYEPDRAIV